MSKRRIIFTDNRQSKRGIMSVVLSTISLSSLLYSFIFSFRHEGEVPDTFGGALVVTLVMSVIGLGLGISARRDTSRFKMLPTIGIAINTLVIILLGFMLWVGLD